MMVFTVLRTRPARAASACCPLCDAAPLLAGERLCHGCRVEATRLGEGRA